ncbi:hypothetical protein VCHA53O466_50371 [Vibrio chagasii]|nr:hypothetical protein VCHA53O466_50371 [Vibrio chagasii]
MSHYNVKIFTTDAIKESSLIELLTNHYPSQFPVNWSRRRTKEEVIEVSRKFSRLSQFRMYHVDDYNLSVRDGWTADLNLIDDI